MLLCSMGYRRATLRAERSFGAYSAAAPHAAVEKKKLAAVEHVTARSMMSMQPPAEMSDPAEPSSVVTATPIENIYSAQKSAWLDNFSGEMATSQNLARLSQKEFNKYLEQSIQSSDRLPRSGFNISDIEAENNIYLNAAARIGDASGSGAQVAADAGDAAADKAFPFKFFQYQKQAAESVNLNEK